MSRPDKIVRLTAEQYDYIHRLLINSANEFPMLISTKTTLEAFENGTTKVEQEHNENN